MEPTDIGRIDALLQAAQTLRLSERGRARDAWGGLVKHVDVNGRRIGALTVGLVDALLVAHDGPAYLLPLLIYALLVSDHGPGPRAVEESRRLLALKRSGELRRYVTLGHRIASRAFAGEPADPGGFAELLLSEISPG